MLSPAQKRTLEHAQTFDRQIQLLPVGGAQGEIERLVNTISEEQRVERFSDCLVFLPERIQAEFCLHFRQLFEAVFEHCEAPAFDMGSTALKVAEILSENHGPLALDISKKALVKLRAAIREAQEKHDNALQAKAHYQLARVFALRGKFSQAILELRKLVSKLPDYADASVHFQLAHLSMRRNKRSDLQAAERHFREALDRDPAHQNAAVGLARLYEERGEKIEAVRIIQDFTAKLESEGKPSSGLYNEIGVMFLSSFRKHREKKARLLVQLASFDYDQVRSESNAFFVTFWITIISFSVVLNIPKGKTRWIPTVVGISRLQHVVERFSSDEPSLKL